MHAEKYKTSRAIIWKKTMTEPAVEMTAIEAKRKKKIEEQELERQKEVVLDKHIPKPVGYRVMVALANVEDKFDGGIAKATQTIRKKTFSR